MNCAQCEERLSEYLDSPPEAVAGGPVDRHLQTCQACRELAALLKETLAAAAAFPDHPAPEWLATRILANTPRIARETWRDTAATMLELLAEPRIAMIVFTATIVLGWIGSVAGISPAVVVGVMQEPSILYYEAGTRVNRVYSEAVRMYYRTPLVTEIQAQIERLREIS
jgi:predicted anti-sigma-YlaC factor YlaD